MLVKSPSRDCVVWAFDSRRWAGYRSRPDDIVIATYPKCGTTWMQRIVGMLVFGSPDPRAVMEISIWPDMRMAPIEAVEERLEAQTHRRFLKAHLPFDALPIHDEVRYVHVARDGRDAALSFHNQMLQFVPEFRGRLDAIGRADSLLARPYPEPLEDPAAFFHRWMTEGSQAGATDGLPLPSYFDFEHSWWKARDRDNVLMVHYADLKADLEGEMRRVAAFLAIEIASDLWPRLVEAADFQTMRRDGDALMGRMAANFRDGSARFFNKGVNGRWRGVFHDADLALYDAATARLPDDCAQWLASGRLARIASA